MRRTWIVIMAAGFLLSLGGLGVTGAQAASTRPAVTTSNGTQSHAVTQAKAPAARRVLVDSTWCAQSGAGYCLNRSQCATASGTHVIMWVLDYDNCEDFLPIPTVMCGEGNVTQTCPFTVGSGLNARYAGSKIWYIKAYNESNECLATSSGGLGILGSCPDRNGNGGSNGVIFVQNAAGYMVNRYWSDYNYSLGEYNAPSWMCSPGSQGHQVLLYDDTGTAGACQWDTN